MKEAATSMETSLLAAEKGQNSGVWIYLARTCRIHSGHFFLLVAQLKHKSITLGFL